MRHLNTIGLGSIGVVTMAILTGCTQQQQDPQNRFLVIEQQADGKYIVVEEMPTEGKSRAIIREKDEYGVTRERFMNEDEMRKLAEQEYSNMQNGNSELNSPAEQGGSGGMGLGGTILAAAAGAMMGNMIANSLMGNKNFQSRASSSNKSAYSRNKSGSASKRGSSAKKSFFGGSRTGSSRSGSRSYGS
ncbi:MAG: hypothetical protein GQ570_12880 [Helicobacteraceae bacterium]|nr:hypothetical protein [Helicobacteraceae bacterium]